MCVSWKSVQEILPIFPRRTLRNELSILRSELEAPSCNKRYMCVTTTEVDMDVSKNMLCPCSIQNIEQWAPPTYTASQPIQPKYKSLPLWKTQQFVNEKYIGIELHLI